MKILLGVTGSVAAIKLPELIGALGDGNEVRVVATKSAMNIIHTIKGYKVTGSRTREGYLALHKIVGVGEPAELVEHIITDDNEWRWGQIGDPVLHIDLKDWADALVIAPLTANTMAKMAHGICDNLLSCIVRAWPINRRIVVAPAMNTDMWNHPITREQLISLRKRYQCYGSAGSLIDGLFLVPPVEKKLACGTTGVGAMAAPEDIAKAVENGPSFL